MIGDDAIFDDDDDDDMHFDNNYYYIMILLDTEKSKDAQLSHEKISNASGGLGDTAIVRDNHVKYNNNYNSYNGATRGGE